MIHQNPIRFDWWSAKYTQQVMEIEQKACDFPHTQRDFFLFLRERDCIGQVVLAGERVVGFMVYDIYQRSIHLLHIAVHPEWQKRGIGGAMLKKLDDKYTSSLLMCITANVRESDLRTQLFLQKHGYKCVSVHQNWYFDTNESSFLFIKHKPEAILVVKEGEIEGSYSEKACF